MSAIEVPTTTSVPAGTAPETVRVASRGSGSYDGGARSGMVCPPDAPSQSEPLVTLDGSRSASKVIVTTLSGLSEPWAGGVTLTLRTWGPLPWARRDGTESPVTSNGPPL